MNKYVEYMLNICTSICIRIRHLNANNNAHTSQAIYLELQPVR